MAKGLQRSLSRGDRAQTEVIRSIALGSPVVGTATLVKAAIALTVGAQAGITAGITSPAVPRNITVKGNASGIAGDVVIHGTNREGATISETIALNGATEAVGAKAFATVTSIDYPAETHSGTDTVSIGAGAKIGLGVRLPRNTVIAAFLAGVREATAPTVAFSSSALESNTVTLSSTLDGSAVVVDLYE